MNNMRRVYSCTILQIMYVKIYFLKYTSVVYYKYHGRVHGLNTKWTSRDSFYL